MNYCHEKCIGTTNDAFQNLGNFYHFFPIKAIKPLRCTGIYWKLKHMKKNFDEMGQ